MLCAFTHSVCFFFLDLLVFKNLPFWQKHKISGLGKTVEMVFIIKCYTHWHVSVQSAKIFRLFHIATWFSTAVCAGWISSSPVWRRWEVFPCAPVRVCCREKASLNWLSNTASTHQHTGSTPWWEGKAFLIIFSWGAAGIWRSGD